MHQEVYIDIVFAANLLVDYILLRLTGIVLRRKNSRRRCLAAAAVGALFACLNLYVRPGKTGVLTIVLRVVCAVFMIWIAYEIHIMNTAQTTRRTMVSTPVFPGRT